MAQAAELVAECDILKKHPHLSLRLGTYSYQIRREGDRSMYSVSDGKQTISEPILWAFGQGEAGQTYVIQHDGVYYQSRASFFNDTQSLDRTLGVPAVLPTSLEDALGLRMGPGDARLCIACHTTGAVSGTQLHVQSMTVGVTCEACHGPGAEHVAAMKAGKFDKTFIFNPGKLAASDLDDFCGSCHRTWWQVQQMHVRG